ncbi:hypothetical protein DUNSADRAFT_10756 [Dunaliella salina]|uniref:Encoded protein n=1 Tax=Dunaliella salina TaxID=3046 RepID=A0ABQ7GEL5_DUNSA|nr:hypothetical protein DUNSADRAFT_10756 [Dunaliella salina]|eukprot:KAF5833050.1 hypothetical protein DUNSADRAFT_10756 [Dunaliella salina]
MQEELVLQAPWRLCQSQFSPGDIGGVDQVEGKLAAPWRIQLTPHSEMEAGMVTEGLAECRHASAPPLSHHQNSLSVAEAAAQPLPSSQGIPELAAKGSPAVSEKMNDRHVLVSAAVNSPSHVTPSTPAAALVQQLLTLQHL